MKKLSIIISVLITTVCSVIAQEPSGKIDEFRSAVLPQYNIYFLAAETTENGQLKLTSTSGFNELSVENKTAIMDMLVRSWQSSLIIVENGSSRDLWGVYSKSGKAMLIDSWNTDGIYEIKPPQLPLSKYSLHPFLFNSAFSSGSIPKKM